MDKDGNAGAGRAVERKAEDIARQHREDGAREALAGLDPDRSGRDTQPAADEEDRTDEDDGDEEDETEDDGGPTPV